MTHVQLVDAAVRWLRRSRHAADHGPCGLVFAEIVTATGESPDAIGWAYGRWSVLVECKVSRSDFHRDRHKPHRAHDARMGRHRWYLTPPGLLRPEDLPAGWGLAELHGRRVVVVAPASPRQSYDWRAELVVLASAVRRHECGSAWNAQRARFETLADRLDRTNTAGDPPAQEGA